MLSCIVCSLFKSNPFNLFHADLHLSPLRPASILDVIEAAPTTGFVAQPMGVVFYTWRCLKTSENP